MKTEFPLCQEGEFLEPSMLVNGACARPVLEISASWNSLLRKHAVALGFLLLLPGLLAAATNDLTTTLQKGLFEEEANHNLGAAIQLYQSVISQFDKDRKLAATAVFRLAECYRKQGNTNEANAQYDRVLREFADQTQLTTLSRQNLLALGGTATQAAATPTAARQEQKRLLEEELALLEKKLATDRMRVETGVASSEELLSTQREMLQVKRQIAALDAGAPVIMDLLAANAPTNQPSTSAEAEEVRRIQAMIKDSPDLINAKPEKGLAPLNEAASKGHLVVAQFLLDHGANVQIKNPAEEWTPLHYAANNGHKAIVELLLTWKAFVNAADRFGKTALHLAAAKGFRSVVEVLLEHGADINEKDQNGATPLHFAVGNSFRSVTELLLGKGADPNISAPNVFVVRRNISGTPLHEAADIGDKAVAELLLNHKSDPNSTDFAGKTPLDVSAGNGNTGLAELLLSQGAEVNVKNQNANELGWTALHYAVLANQKETVDLLLKHKADPNATIQTGFAVNPGPMAPPGQLPFSPGYTPLLMACTKGYTEVAESLLAAKANPNLASQSGATPIINDMTYVAQPERRRILAFLLEHGADPEARNPDGKTALLMAANNKDRESLEILLQHKAEPNAKTQYGYTPLHELVSGLRYGLAGPASTDVPAMAEALIRAGADVNAQDRQGKTPLNYLSEMGPSFGIIELQQSAKKFAEVLRKAGAVEDLARMDVLQISRRSANYLTPVIAKGTNDYNYFTLFELIAAHYGFIAANAKSIPNVLFDLPSHSAQSALGFPDLANVVIRRPKPDRTQWTTQNVNLAGIFQSDFALGNCSGDERLRWGDVVEIPEADHPINAVWQGLPEKGLTVLDRCLSRQVQLTVKGSTTNLLLRPGVIPTRPGMPKVPSFYLVSVLFNSGTLRASSDLSRVKVSRRDPTSGQSFEMVFDCSPNRAPDQVPDLWLRDGDSIVVPEKPES